MADVEAEDNLLPEHEPELVLGDDEDEGASSGEPDSSDEEGSDDNEYEEDGFVVNEASEEGEAVKAASDAAEGGSDGEEGAVVKKKPVKKKKRKAFELDEEDYDLLEDNQVTVRAPRAVALCDRAAAARVGTRGTQHACLGA
jgi:transcription elongation factor SPT6